MLLFSTKKEEYFISLVVAINREKIVIICLNDLNIFIFITNNNYVHKKYISRIYKNIYKTYTKAFLHAIT